MKEKLYSIRDLEVLSGIKSHTIRIWEKRYNLFSPERTDTNIRFYSDADLRKILNISALLKLGYRISKVAGMDNSVMKEILTSEKDGVKTEDDFIERLIVHLVNFDHRGFDDLLGEVISLFGFEEALRKIIFPFFQKIGTFWQVGSVFPAQEHYVSNLLRQKLIAEIDKLGFETSRDGTILFFLHEKEMHELSLLYYAYLARRMGYGVMYLGQFVPLEDIRKLSGRGEIRYGFTAFLAPIEKNELEDYLAELKEALPERKIFITGYQVMEHHPALPRNVKVVADYHDFRRYLK